MTDERFQDPRWVTDKSGVAAFFDVSLTTVGNWVRRGCPVKSRADKSKIGSGYEFYLPDVARWKMDLERVQTGVGSQEFEKSRLTKLQADQAQEKLEVSRRELVSAKAVIELWQQQLAMFRSRLLGVRTKLAPRLAKKSKASECEELLAVEHEAALEELSGEPLPAGVGENLDRESPDSETATEDDSVRVGGQKPKAKSRGKRRTRTVAD